VGALSLNLIVEALFVPERADHAEPSLRDAKPSFLVGGEGRAVGAFLASLSFAPESCLVLSHVSFEAAYRIVSSQCLPQA